MHLNLTHFASFLALVCSFAESAEIKLNKIKIERQKKMSSPVAVLSSFPATTAVYCIALCNINDECLHGTFDEVGAWCYLYSNKNPSIEDQSNSLVFTTCVIKEVANLTTYDDQPTVVGALSTFPADRYLSFHVKSCPPISIHFKGETAEWFFIDIGRPSGPLESRINYGMVYGRLEFYHNDPIMTCGTVSSFWITWFDDMIKVGKGNVIDHDTFMEMQVAGIITPRTLLRVGTGMVTAEWSFNMNQDKC